MDKDVAREWRYVQNSSQGIKREKGLRVPSHGWLETTEEVMLANAAKDYALRV